MERAFAGGRIGVNGASSPPAQRVRLVVVGTDTAARLGLLALMEVAPGVDIVVEAADGEQAANILQTHHPDLVLLSGEAMRTALDLPGQKPWAQGQDAPSPAICSTGGSNGDGPGVSRALTRREREVMDLIAAGLSNRQIADALVVSQKTVKNHICRIYQRIGVHERSQAIGRWKEFLGAQAP